MRGKLEADKQLYTIAVMRYKEENPNLGNNLFSTEWNISKDYRLKTIIISEAIKNHILVEATDLYKENFIDKII